MVENDHLPFFFHSARLYIDFDLGGFPQILVRWRISRGFWSLLWVRNHPGACANFVVLAGRDTLDFNVAASSLRTLATRPSLLNSIVSPYDHGSEPKEGKAARPTALQALGALFIRNALFP
jgi:hypothetical protein